ncbi:MAG: polysaccharide biosynthesis/export family protein [Ginsengibacter sp.]
MISQIIRIFLYVLIVIQIGLSNMSCISSRKTVYFYDVKDTTFLQPDPQVQTPIHENDILSISISSLNETASAIFNKPNENVRKAATATGSFTESSGYLVNTDGYIQLPILGNIKAAGLTKSQLKENITNTILSKKLLIDPIVDIRYLNFEVTVIGEVAHPTVITVPSEKISLIKAIGLAGDLTIYGKRENVLLIREEDGKRKTRHINLNSPNFFNSPYYYLHPNDVVYVEPNKAKVATAGRTQQLLPIILSSLSIVVIVLDRVIK